MKTWIPCYSPDTIQFVHIDRPWWQPAALWVVDTLLFFVEGDVYSFFDNTRWEAFWDRISNHLRSVSMWLMDFEMDISQISVPIDTALLEYHNLTMMTSDDRFSLYDDMCLGRPQSPKL